ncbi:hypothetical protein LG284_05410 [Citricoccus nitrophenolicus]
MTHSDGATTRIFELDGELEQLLSRLRRYPDSKDWTGWAYTVLSGPDPTIWRVDDQGPEYADDVLTLAGLGHLHDNFSQVHTGGYPDDEHPETVHGLERAALNHLAHSLLGRLRKQVGTSQLMATLVYSMLGDDLNDYPEEDEFDEELDEQEHRSSRGPYQPAGADTVTTLVADEKAYHEVHNLVLNASITSEKQRTYAWLDGSLDLER